MSNVGWRCVLWREWGGGRGGGLRIAAVGNAGCEVAGGLVLPWLPPVPPFTGGVYTWDGDHAILGQSGVNCFALVPLADDTCVWFALQKKAMESINSRLALVMKSGKAVLGYKDTLRTLRKAQGAVCSTPNCQTHSPL